MEALQSIGRVFIVLGLIFLLVGILLYFGKAIGLGKLPGDIYINRGEKVLFFPISTITLTIFISILVPLILKIVFKK